MRHVTLARPPAQVHRGIMYPSPVISHRRADFGVHMVGITMITACAALLLMRAPQPLWPTLVFIACSVASNLSSQAYHFAPWHDRRVLLRRIDHAAIYLSICGTFTPLLVAAGTPRALLVLAASWACAALGIWLKLRAREVKSRWSTASYLGLGFLSLLALPDVYRLSPDAVWWIVAGSAAYVIGTVFYTRKSLPFRYSIWHAWVVLGGLLMFVGVWQAVA